MRKFLSLFLFGLTLLTACAGGSTTPTPVISLLGTDQPAAMREALTPTPVPFRFDLPTPQNPPVLGWRPPLYPVPWAVAPFDHFYFIRPIPADQVNWPLADYRYGGIYFGPNVVHTGVDIPAPEGTPIMAAGPGTVVWANWGFFSGDPKNIKDPYGQAVSIRHDFGYEGQQLFTTYAHMSKINALVGQHVETGDVIGYVGATGDVTGPHLHFEVRYPDNTFFATHNPELWMAPPQGWGVLAGRIMNEDGETLQILEIDVRNEKTRQSKFVRTYGGSEVINADPVYKENFVLGDLPAGLYRITLFADKKYRQTWVEIFPGQVTFLTYKVGEGFATAQPPSPTPDFLATP
jgi:murein DD-endopeptidase MepM/ murein hydrolase activator NlpD